MTIKVDIQDLLKRMNDDTDDSNPSKTISFLAHREAEKLDDLSLVPELEQLLIATKNKKLRRDIYFILGKIGKNTQNKKIAEILLNCLPRETDKYVLSVIFDRLAEQPCIDNCSPLLPYLMIVVGL